MTKLTVEETNLLSIYKTGSRQGLIVAMNAALPFMDGEMRGFAARTPVSYTHLDVYKRQCADTRRRTGGQKELVQRGKALYRQMPPVRFPRP